jgi:acyl-coenzyme A synthetase/AMP-(fatty) acid ligase
MAPANRPAGWILGVDRVPWLGKYTGGYPQQQPADRPSSRERPMNLSQLITLHGRYRAHHPAIVERDRSFTYRQLDSYVAGHAIAMMRLGVGRGDVVGVCLQDHAEFLACLLAIVRVGGIFLPMDWRWTQAEQQRAAGVFQPKLILAEPGRAMAPGLSIARVDDAWRQAAASNETSVEPAPGGEAPAILALSSGTTGQPKGYNMTHARYLAMCQNYWEAGISQGDRYLSVLPIAFASGRGMALATLFAGATVIMFPTLAAADEIVAGVAEYQATTMCLVPSLSRALLRLPMTTGQPLLPSIRLLVSIGAGLFPEEARAIRKRLTPHLVDLYGSSGGGVTTVLRSEDMDRKAGSVGRPLNGVEVDIVDDYNQPLPPRITGRLRCRAPCMAAGFYRSEGGGDEAYLDGWYYPGDFAYLDEDGYVFLQGRTSEIIIRGGINIFAPEVERAIASYPGVVEVAVLGYPVPDLGEEIAAFVMGRPGIAERDLVRHLRTELAPYKIPRLFHFLDELPRSSTGKILKSKLAESLAASSAPKPAT